MSAFYKKPPATQKNTNYEWPPKRIERTVKVSRQEPPPATEESFLKPLKFEYFFVWEKSNERKFNVHTGEGRKSR